MRVNVRLFGHEAAAAGAASVDLDLPGDSADVAAVRRALPAACPALTNAARAARVAVNHEFADDATSLNPGDEVALIGQVSGG